MLPNCKCPKHFFLSLHCRTSAMCKTPTKWTVTQKDQQQKQEAENKSSSSRQSCTKVLSNKVQTEASKCALTPSPESFLEMRGQTSEEQPCVLMLPFLVPDCIRLVGCSRGTTTGKWRVGAYFQPCFFSPPPPRLLGKTERRRKRGGSCRRTERRGRTRQRGGRNFH